MIKAVPPATSRFTRITRVSWQVTREALRAHADLHHFHDVELIPAGLVLRVLGKKVVYDVHEDYPRRGIFLRRVPGLGWQPLGWILERIEGIAARCFSAIVTVVPAIDQRFSRHNPRTVMVQNFPSAVELQDVSQEDWGERSSAVAYVGQISTIRGVRQMVQAMEMVPGRLNATLELAGAFTPSTDPQPIMALPGWKRVRYAGSADRNQVRRILGQVRAGLAILLPYPNHEHAVPTKLYEYMAAGIPVIASDFAHLRKIVAGANCGLLVNPLDPKAIASAIECILSCPQEAHAMGQRGRAAVETQYNWESEQAKLLDLYRVLGEDV